MYPRIKNIQFEFDRVVVGSSLEALLYSFLNNIPFVFTELGRPHRFSYFDVADDLSDFSIKNTTRKLVSPTVEKETGIKKDFLWEKLYFSLSLAGLNPMADKTSSLSIEDNILKVRLSRGGPVLITFNELIVFDDRGLFGLPDPISPSEKKYKVYDWFDVRSGMRHEYDRIEDTLPFINHILFYPTDRVDGEQTLKDAVSISYLTEEELDSFEYSDINARFKTLYMMKKAGIRGLRNGRDMKDKTKFKYYAVRIENSHRELELLTPPIYKSEGNINFNSESFNDIMNKYEAVDSYVRSIFQ